MNPRVTLATGRRVLAQLHGDPRTIALLLFVPCLLMTLLQWVFADQPETFDRVGQQLLGIFPFVTMFLVTSVAMLHERTSGTLERLLTTPLGKVDLLLGYALAFGLAALAQATLAGALALGVLGLDPDGSAALVLVLAIADAVLGMALGLLVSAFARTEFQAVQFLPAFVLPQVLLCGLIAPRDEMSGVLEAISSALPMTYAVVDIRDAAADTREHAGDAIAEQVDDQVDALDRAAEGAYGAATAGDEFSQDVYEWELEDAVDDLTGNADDFRTTGPEVQQAFWEGYQSTVSA